MYCSRGLGANASSDGQNRTVSAWQAVLTRRSAPCPADWACAWDAARHGAAKHDAAASNLIRTVAAMHHPNCNEGHPNMHGVSTLRQTANDATKVGVVTVQFCTCRVVWTGLE